MKTDYDQIVAELYPEDQPDTATTSDAKAEQQTGLRASMFGAVQTDPDAHAKVVQLSRKTGIPSEVVGRNLQEVERRDAIESVDYGKLLDQTPALAHWAQNPDNAALARDDLDVLGGLETVLKPAQRPVTGVALPLGRAFLGDAVRTVGSQLVGLKEFNEALEHKAHDSLRDMGLGFIADAPSFSPLPGVLPTSEQVRERSASTGKRIKQLGEAIGPDDRNIATDVAGGLGQLGINAAEFAFLGPLSWLLLGAQGADQQAERAQAKGTSESQEDTAVLMGAAVTAATERIGLDRLLNRLPPRIKNRILREVSDVAIAGGIEATQEAVEGFLHNAITRFTFDPQQQLVEGLDRDAIAAGGSAAIFRAAFNALIPGRQREGAESDQATLQALGEAAQNSKLRQRDQVKWREFVTQLRQSGAPDVHVPVEQFETVFNQDPVEAATEILGDPRPYLEAKAAGTDLVIPIDAYADRIAPTEAHAKLMPSLRLGDDRQSLEEVAADESVRSEEFDQVIDEVRRLASQGAPVAGEPSQKVYDDVFGQLTGIMDRGAAERVAKLVQARTNVIARQLGQDPFEYYQNSPLRFSRQLPDDVKTLPEDETDRILDTLRETGVPTEDSGVTPEWRDRLTAVSDVLERTGVDLAETDNTSARRILSTQEPLLAEAAQTLEQGEQSDGPLQLAATLSTRLRDATGSELAKRAAKHFIGKPLENLDTGVRAIVSGNSLAKMLSRSAVKGSLSVQAHMTAVANLDSLFPIAVSSKVRDPVKKGDAGRIAKIHRFDAPMPFGNDVLRVRMLVKELADPKQGNPLYTVTAVEIGKPASEREESSPEGGRSPTPPAGFEDRFAQLLQAVKGEPTVLEQAAPSQAVESLAANGSYTLDDAPEHEDARQLVLFPPPGAGPETEPATTAGAGDVQPGTDLPGQFATVVSQETVREIDLGFERLDTPEQVARAALSVTKSPQEVLLAIATTDDGTPVGILRHTIGVKDGSQVDVGIVAGWALNQLEAKRLWITHNHPSGISELSSADRQLSARLSNLLRGSGIAYEGMLAQVSTGKFTHTERPGVHEAAEPETQSSFPVSERVFTVDEKLSEQAIETPTLAVRQYQENPEPGALLLDNQHTPIGFVPIDWDAAGQLRDTSQHPRLLRAIELTNAAAVIFQAPEGAPAGSVSNVAALFSQANVRPLDAIVYGKSSAGVAVQSDFAQGADDTGGPRGRIRFNPRSPSGRRLFDIALLEKADLSTTLHELGHYFFEDMADAAERADAPQVLKDDYQGLLHWLGVRDRSEVGTEQHEQVARGFEAYLGEGKAPSLELQGIFQRFRAWLVQVYRSLKRLNVQLNDEVREVFDRMLATDEEIEAAREAQTLSPLFAAAADAQLSETEFIDYQRASQEAQAQAEEDVLREQMKLARREHEAWWKKARMRVREEIEAAVNAEPVYRVLSVLRKGEQIDGSPVSELLRDGSGKPMRLSASAIREMYGDQADELLRVPLARATSKTGGVHPDLVADLFGFGSGDEMIQAITKAKPRKQVIEERTDARMNELYPDMQFDGSLAEAAFRAVHNDKQAELLMREAIILQSRIAGSRGNADALRNYQRQLKVIKVAAQRIIGEKPIRDISPILYRRAEAKAGKAAFEAAGKGKFEEASEFKRQQLLNHELYREAVRARDEADKTVEYLRRFNRTSVRQKIGKAGADYLEQIDGVLARYELATVSTRQLDRRRSLREWVERIEADGRAHAIPPEVIEDDRTVNYRELTPELFAGVRDAVKAIEHLARTKRELLLRNERRDLDQVVSEVSSDILANGEAVSDGPHAQRLGEILSEHGKEALAGFMTPDTILRGLSGFKDHAPVYRHIKGVIDRAIAEDLLPMREKAGEALLKLQSVYSRSEWKRILNTRVYIPETDTHWTKEMMLALALNWGNEGSRQAVVDAIWPGGKKLTPEQVGTILNRLDKRDWDFVQSVWDYVDSFWPEIAETQRQRTGLMPAKVEAAGVETKFGTYRGGYYPLAYDRSADSRVREEQEADLFTQLRAGRFGAKHTKRGHTIERVGSGGRPPRLSLSVLHSHINQVVYDLALGDSVNYAYRVLNERDTRAAFVDTGNLAYWDALDIWLKDVAAGELAADGWFNRTLRFLRTGFTTSVLAWNVGTALIQPTGYLQTVVKIRPKYAAAGLYDLVRGPWHGEHSVFSQIMGQSAFMRKRTQTFNKDVMDAVNQIRGSAARDAFAKTAFWMMERTQLVVDAATWLGAIRKAHDQGIEGDEAIQFADRMVAQAQASGIFSDRSALERGTVGRRVQQAEFVRIWTVLGSYMIAKGSMAYERTRKTSFKDPVQVFSWTADMVMLFTIEALIIQAIRGGWPDDDEDESKLGFVLGETANSVLGTMPFVREISSSIQGFRGGSVINSFADRVGRAWTQTMQGELDAALVKSLNDLGGILLHYPSIQMNRFIDAAWRDAEGEDVAPIEYILKVKRAE